VAARSRIIGLGGLDAALKAKASLMRAATVAAVALEVKSVKSDAEREAPRDTGELVGSIRGRTTGTRGEVEASAEHAGFQEFGTSRSAAQPFMGPAADKSRSRFVGRVSGAVRKAVS
jgi:HK97 gp10 family phage protein